MTWEDADRPPLELFFEADSEFASDLQPEPNAFLLAVMLPAFRNGERRVRVDGEVCPLLCEGLETVMGLQRVWHGGNRPLVEIEAVRRRAFVRGADRAGLCLTGGVDSLHALWWNRRTYSLDHPASFRDAIYLEGLSFPEATPSARNRDVTRRQLGALAAIAAKSNLTVVSVRSNIRMLEPDNDFMAQEGLSSMLASAAHALSRRLSSVSFGALLDLDRLVPRGSHPLLDPNYCSSAMDFRQEDWTIGRLSKIRHIAGWDTAIENMMVCFEGPLPDGRLNCGECEKCLRTMAGLWIAGRLSEATAFPRGAVTAEIVDRIEPAYHLDLLPNFWDQFVDPFQAIGRPDLSKACRRLVARARRKQRWIEGSDWKGALRRFDRAHLDGLILRASRRIRGSPGSEQPS